MRRLSLFIAALGALLGALLIAPTAASASLQQGCNGFVSGPTGIATCGSMSASTSWYVIVACSSQFAPAVAGNIVTGNGTSSATCIDGPAIRVDMFLTQPVGQIVSRYAGLCVDVSNANTANGTHIQLWGCNGTNAQRFTVGSDGRYRVLGKCLDVTGGGTANSTLVQLWDCNGTGAQQWRRQGDTLINPQSGRCLDDLGFNTAQGALLGIWDCNGFDNQKWTFPN